jgi:hypothetical protein
MNALLPIVLLLSVVTVCLLLMTIEMLRTAREMRHTFKTLNGIMAHVHGATQAVDTVVRQGCGLAVEAMTHVERWPYQLGNLLTRRWGHGVGVEPRRRSRALGKRR